MVTPLLPPDDALPARQTLRAMQARQWLLLAHGGVAWWSVELGTAALMLSPQARLLLADAPGTRAPVWADLCALAAPADGPALTLAFDSLAGAGRPVDLGFELRPGGSGRRRLRLRAAVLPGTAPARAEGTLLDVTASWQAGLDLAHCRDESRAALARVRAMLDAVPFLWFVLGDDGRLIEVSRSDHPSLALPWSQARGRPIAELVPPAGAGLAAAALARARAGSGAERIEYRLATLVGGEQAFEARIVAIGDGRWLYLTRDISDRVTAEQALREQREAYAAVFEAASDAIVSVDAEGAILLFNPGAERVFQHRAASVLGQPLDRLLPVAQQARHAVDVAAFAAHASSRRAMGAGRVKGLRADGQALDLEASISQAVVGGRVVLTAILRDVTERVRAEADALRHRFELWALTRQLLEQEKRSAQRLAQVLHDQLGQTLTALRIAIDRERLAPAADAAEAARRRAQAAALIDQCLQQVRQVLVELRPPLLDEEGLYAALDNELRVRAELHPLVDQRLDAPAAVQALRWPAEVEYALFMIAREALDNALRHAGATLVRVALQGDAAGVRVEVVDDGVGIAAGAERARPGHLGLIGMRERARAIGARLELGTAVEGGTRVGVDWAPPT